MSATNGKPRGRPPYRHSKAALPKPGDEQCGDYSHARLVRMDNRFRARLLRAFKRGKESRQAAANQPRSRLLVGEIVERSLKLRRCRLGLLGSPLPRLLLVLALFALADEFGPQLTLPTAHASRALSNARWRTCWSAGHAIEQRLSITTGKKPKRCPQRRGVSCRQSLSSLLPPTKR